MKRRPLPSPACVTKTGRSRPVATGSNLRRTSWIVTATGAALGAGEGDASVAVERGFAGAAVGLAATALADVEGGRAGTAGLLVVAGWLVAVESIVASGADAWVGAGAVAGSDAELGPGPAFAQPQTAINKSTSRPRPIGQRAIVLP
jgi:hypothetical protein